MPKVDAELTRVNWFSGECDATKSRRGLDARLETYLLHDAGLPLGKGNVPARLVLNELDLNLSPLAAGLVVILVIVVGGRTRPFCASIGIAGDEGAIAIANALVIVN
jgi:hypothetical protein